MSEEIEEYEDEPSFEPEYCEDGGLGGLECEMQLRGGSWWCTTCNQWR